MLLLGLTGSIATGKSTVSSILSSPPYSLPLIDADLLARKVVEPGTAGYKAVLAAFASTTPDLLLPASDPQSGGREDGPNGLGRPLNRPALGRRVFGGAADTQEARRTLNGIVHPAVQREMWLAMARAYLSGSWAVVLDIPLLYESGWERLCGAVMVVAVHEPELQMSRLRARDPHLSPEDAQNRVASQMDVREKADMCLRRGPGAGVVVWNDSDKAHLRREIDRVMAELQRRSPKWWAWLLLLCPPAGVAAATWSFLRSWYIQSQWRKEKEREKAKL